MTSNPLVSIVIMCYNQETFIVDALESCLLQTYKNIEICVSDDCSTDNTFFILLDYQKKYPHIIRIKQLPENMWKYSLWFNVNSMLSMAQWKYIAWLDGDDIMSHDRIEKQVDFLEKNADHVWVSWWLEAFDHKTWQSLWNIHTWLNVRNRSPETLISSWNSIPPCLMFRNWLWVEWSTSLKIMIDWLLYIEIAIKWKIGHLNECLGKYRIHWNNSIKKNLLLDHLLTLDIVDHKYSFIYSEETQKARINIYWLYILEFFRQNGKNIKNLIFCTRILLTCFRIDFFYTLQKIIFLFSKNLLNKIQKN